MPKCVELFSPLLIVSSVWLGGCYFQAGAAPPPQPVAYVASTPPPPPPPPMEAQPVVEAAPEYYYGGPHFYPLALGGEWCPIAEPHVHDFPPDHPEYYAYDSGYYYYAGRPGEVYVVGRTPPGARVHVVHEGDAHEWRRLPPNAERPRLVGGRYPTRESHPAPLRPVAERGAPEPRGPVEHQNEPARAEGPVANREEQHLAHPAEAPAPLARTKAQEEAEEQRGKEERASTPNPTLPAHANAPAARPAVAARPEPAAALKTAKPKKQKK